MGERVLVIGLGQLLGGDDAAGVLVARDLGARLPGQVEVVTEVHRWWSLPGEDLTRREVVLIDACLASTDLPVGRLRRFDYPADRAVLAHAGWKGSHSLDPLALLDLASALGHLPPSVPVFAIGAASFAVGTACCPELARALPEVVEEIEAYVLSSGKAGRCMNSRSPAASSASRSAVPSSTVPGG
jgi:hydrogenase maturation protease